MSKKIEKIRDAYNAETERKNHIDYTMPGNSTWTRGDGTRYRDPGVMVAWWGGKKEKAPVKAFTEWLKNHPKTKHIGGVKDWYGSSQPRDAYVLGGVLFTIENNGERVEYGSPSRLRNTDVWRQKQKESKKMNEASELKPFKVTYKTTSGKESTCTVKARDEKEAKAKCRSKPNYAGNAVATLKEAANDEKNDKVMRWFQKTFGNTGMKMIRSDDYHEFDHYDNTVEVGNPGGVWYYAVTINPRDPNHKKFVKQIRNKIEGGMFESKLTEGVLDDVDDDGFMAKRQLYDLAKYSVELHRMIQDTDDLEPWVQAKITKAADYIDTVKHYLEYSGVRNAEDTADVMGPPEMADIDAVSSNLDSMISMETEVMEYGDEDEGSEIYPDDVLRWAVNRGVISDEQYEAPSPELMGAAEDTASWIGTVYEVGSSDVSIWLKDFVNAAKGSGVMLDGERAHLYESQLKAKMIYRNMLRELKEKK